MLATLLAAALTLLLASWAHALPEIQLTSHPADDMSPAWSPDGQMIAFSSTRSGNPDIWVIPANGGEARQLTSHPAPDFEPTWSPDGTQIAFSSTRSGNFDIW